MRQPPDKRPKPDALDDARDADSSTGH
jgi:hypothetical protein